MSSDTTTSPARASARRRTWHTALTALVLAGAFSVAGLAMSPSAAVAATLTVDQCNDVGPGPGGATTGMTCTVTVVNTIDGSRTSSTTTVTRECSLDPCAPGNGTFTTSSTDLVTAVNQCNGSDNDSAHPIRCDVTITNNIRGDAPGAQPVTAATVNQCVGSGAGGGGTVNCSPFPATTTGATVTQCNGSGNGGGGTVDCAVGTESVVSPAIPITVNQCNGTGNPGGSVVTCRTTIITAVSPASTATPAPAASPAAGSGDTDSDTDSASDSDSDDSTAQVSRVPSGGVAAGEGPNTGLQHVWLLAVGGVLFIGAVASVLLRPRLAAAMGRLGR